MTSAAIRMLKGEVVVLDEYRKTKMRFFAALPITFATSALVLFLITALIFIVWPAAFNVLLHPVAFGLCFVVFALADWHSIGMRQVYVEPQKRSIMISSSASGGEIKTRHVSFDESIVLRHWSNESEGESAAFVIRLVASKSFLSPSDAGYSLHRELANAHPEQAEQISNEICLRLSSQFGIEYLDIQGSDDPRYAPWSNSSIKRTP